MTLGIQHVGLVRQTGRLFALCAMLVFALSNARAEETAVPSVPGGKIYKLEKNAFDYLMTEPATLMDLGIMKMRLDLKAAARRLYDGGVVSSEPLAGAYYDWRSKGFILYVSIQETLSQPNANQCVESFAHVQRSILGTHPKGPNQAGYYLESIFGHAMFPRWGRPAGLIEGLMNATKLEVVILPPDPMQGGKKVACNGTLDAKAEDVTMETTS